MSVKIIYIFVWFYILLNSFKCENYIAKSIGMSSIQKETYHSKYSNTTFTRIMVIGGRNNTGALSDVELIDPYNANSKCSKPPEFPQQRYYMVADFVNGDPEICGGYSNNTFSNVTMEEVCFKLLNKTNKWEFHDSPSLRYPRVYAAGSMVNGSWWITGGYHWYYPSFMSSDILPPHSPTFKPSADLPERMMDHCMATINGTHVFIAGGSYGSGQQGTKTYLLF